MNGQLLNTDRAAPQKIELGRKLGIPAVTSLQRGTGTKLERFGGSYLQKLSLQGKGDRTRG